MKRIENHCIGCADDTAYRCMGNRCPKRNVAVYYCDECDPNLNCPLDEVFSVDGKEICEDCLKEKFRKRVFE